MDQTWYAGKRKRTECSLFTCLSEIKIPDHRIVLTLVIGCFHSTIPSFPNLAGISSMWMPIFSGSLSRPTQRIRGPSGISIRPYSLSAWYYWYFSYSLLDIGFIITSTIRSENVNIAIIEKIKKSLILCHIFHMITFFPRLQPDMLPCSSHNASNEPVQFQMEYNLS